MFSSGMKNGRISSEFLVPLVSVKFAGLMMKPCEETGKGIVRRDWEINFESYIESNEKNYL